MSMFFQSSCISSILSTIANNALWTDENKQILLKWWSDKLQDFEEMFVHLSIPLCDQGNQLNLYRVHNLPLKVTILSWYTDNGDEDASIKNSFAEVRDGYSVTADLDTEYLLTAK